jgi:hypothetical protein
MTRLLRTLLPVAAVIMHTLSAVIFWGRPITERDALGKNCFVYYCDKD